MSDLHNFDIRYPHQFWFLAILRAFIPELSTNTQKGRRRHTRNLALWITGVWTHFAHCCHRIAKRPEVPVATPISAHPK